MNMKATFATLVALPVSMCALSTVALAELKLPKPSPKVELEARVGVTDISVEYSSPAVKKREIFGSLVPYGALWRTGANECTKVGFSEDVSILDKSLPKGEYCLFTIPNKNSWEVIFNRDAGLNGTNGYDEAKNAVQVEVPTTTTPLRERFAITVENFTDDRADLVIGWDRVAVAVPLIVETKEHALRNIAALNADDSFADYTLAAEYLFERGDDLTKALQLAQTSEDKSKNWRNQWIKARILQRQDKTAEAITLAKGALALGDNSGAFNFFKPQIESAVAAWQQ